MNHAVVPDSQVRPGQDLTFLKRIGTYIAEKRPERIIHLGDFADLPSLSSYDKGKASFEGRRYTKDIDASKRGMDALMEPIRRAKGYKPQLTMLLGNHENRINRAVDDQPELGGLISTDDLKYADYGWEVHPFLKTVRHEGVIYSHYFTSGVMGRPITSAAALLTKKHMSCIAGHQQGRQIAYSVRADGSTITGMIIGSCYEGNEAYLGPQGNRHWRGLAFLHDVRNGSFDEMMVSLSYLKRRYGDCA